MGQTVLPGRVWGFAFPGNLQMGKQTLPSPQNGCSASTQIGGGEGGQLLQVPWRLDPAQVGTNGP